MNILKEKNKQFLFDFLSVIDKKLKYKIILVAAGGTAMTLLDIKNSTRDVDFTGPSKDIEEFKRTLSFFSTGLEIHCWKDGRVFTQDLPEDYLIKSIRINFIAGNIELMALHPLDIIVTKVGRYNARDVQDIKDCINWYKIDKNSIYKRGIKVLETYPGNDKVYLLNLDQCINDNFNL